VIPVFSTTGAWPRSVCCPWVVAKSWWATVKIGRRAVASAGGQGAAVAGRREEM
jgi:hypothetical protein